MKNYFLLFIISWLPVFLFNFCNAQQKNNKTIRYKIHEIQGNSERSPLVGTKVNTRGIATAVFPGKEKLNGFFMQEEKDNTDDDPRTSEGIFIDAPGSLSITPGDLITIEGIVQEKHGLTILTDVEFVKIEGKTSVPDATVIHLPFQNKTCPERYESMLVTIPGRLHVVDNYHLHRYGTVILSPKMLYQPTQIVSPGIKAINHLQSNRLHQILLDDGISIQYPEELIFLINGFSAARSLRAGSYTENLTAILAYDYNNYRLYPINQVDFEVPKRPVPPELKGTLRIISINLQNFFNGDGMGSGFPAVRGASSLTEFERQRTKIISAINSMNPTIVCLVELENDGFEPTSAIANLTDGLNTFLDPASHYSYIIPPVTKIGTDEITTGIIFRAKDVLPAGETKILTSSVDSRFNDSYNRPSLAQVFKDNTTGKHFTVVVNHLKSKGSPCDNLNDPDQDDGQGNCNLTRKDAVIALKDWVKNFSSDTSNMGCILTGDFNAYANEDPIQVLENAGYINLLKIFGGDTIHTYTYNGMKGYLDHALVSEKIFPYINGAGAWHINSDEPPAIDYNMENKNQEQIMNWYAPDPHRFSDHDPVYIDLSLNAKTAMPKEKKNSNSIMLFPNPFQETVQIQSPSRIDRVQFFTIDGKEVLNSLGHEKKAVNIHLPYLPNGVYFTRITTKKDTYFHSLKKAGR
ncbi:MAG: ExeM/NucH family extracellular endonuclease [Bacteroidales bacterium]